VFYCAGGVAANSGITVTPSATDGAAGDAISFNISAVDANGYPVADGTSVSLVANNGAGIIHNAKTTSNGTFKSTSLPSVVLGSTGPVNVTALNNGKSGSAQVTVNGSQTNDAIDAANEATDAANAATDAANAAAEAADAATAAAQDAQAAVAELATSVASLIAGIKAQITSLTNLVIKIQKKVKA